jgi:hypothetical protein
LACACEGRRSVKPDSYESRSQHSDQLLTAALFALNSPHMRQAARQTRSIAKPVMAEPNAPPVYNGKYADELRATANAMVAPGKGLLACDESTGTVGKRLESIGLENNEDNRRTWRNLLFTTEGIGQYISGAILFEETLYQNDPDGKPFVDVLKANGIIPGIKVDRGLQPLVVVVMAKIGARV